MRALARDREARYATAEELAKELDAYVMTGGRIVNPATLLDIMTNLFPGERDRDASWFDQLELPIRTVPLAPISLMSTELVSEESSLRSVENPLDATAALERTEPQATLPTGPSVIEIAPSPSPSPAPLDSSASPVEPSTGEAPAGVPRGPLALLSPGEIAMFAALALLVVAAIATAAFTSWR
jgi:hypothetical protein